MGSSRPFSTAGTALKWSAEISCFIVFFFSARVHRVSAMRGLCLWLFLSRILLLCTFDFPTTLKNQFPFGMIKLISQSNQLIWIRQEIKHNTLASDSNADTHKKNPSNSIWHSPFLLMTTSFTISSFSFSFFCFYFLIVFFNNVLRSHQTILTSSDMSQNWYYSIWQMVILLNPLHSLQLT